MAAVPSAESQRARPPCLLSGRGVGDTRRSQQSAAPGRVRAPELGHGGIPVSDFCFQNREEYLSVYKPPSLWDSVTAAGTEPARTISVLGEQAESSANTSVNTVDLSGPPLENVRDLFVTSYFIIACTTFTLHEHLACLLVLLLVCSSSLAIKNFRYQLTDNVSITSKPLNLRGLTPNLLSFPEISPSGEGAGEELCSMSLQLDGGTRVDAARSGSTPGFQGRPGH